MVSAVSLSSSSRPRGPAAPRAASSGAGRAPRRRGARALPSCARCARRRRAGARGLGVSPRGLRQDPLVERRIRDGAAQARVLRFQPLQALHSVALQPPELPAPAVVGHLRHADGPDRVSHAPALRRQHVHLPQLGHDLLGLVPLLRHLGPPPARTHTSGRTTSVGEDHRSRARSRAVWSSNRGAGCDRAISGARRNSPSAPAASRGRPGSRERPGWSMRG